MVYRLPDYRPNPHLRGCMRLDDTAAPISAVLTTPGTYYQLDTDIVDGNCNGFTLDASGNLTYTGPSGKVFQFAGSANIEADKVCTVNFALFINGVRQTDATTPITFDNANSKEQISIVRGIELQKDDVLTVRATSDTATTTLTVAFFSVVTWGE